MSEANALKTAASADMDQMQLRRALGRFATGVTVVTCQGASGPIGITANSFASVSLYPPLVLWLPAKATRRYTDFVKARLFSIHVLDETQLSLSHAFAKNGSGFDGLVWEYDARQVPILKHALARFDCHLHAQHDGGDHTIILGHVDHFETSDGQPLIFSQGSYNSLPT